MDGFATGSKAVLERIIVPCAIGSLNNFSTKPWLDYIHSQKMILEIAEFRNRVVHDLPTLVSDLQCVTGRFGDEEATAWSNSLPRLARAFAPRDLTVCTYSSTATEPYR
jgi:hypothetical protein